MNCIHSLRKVLVMSLVVHFCSIALGNFDPTPSNTEAAFAELGGGGLNETPTDDTEQKLLRGSKFHEDRITQRKKTNLTKKQKRDFISFYKNTEFPSGVLDEIRSQNRLASSSETLSELKEVLPTACDRVLEQVATTVKNKVSPVHLEGPKDVSAACPKWNNLSVEQKHDFYVALVTAMAMAESSCNNNVRARGTNSTAYGLWQGTRKRSPTQGAQWVMDQIESQIRQSGKLFWEDSKLNYWAVLNPNIHAYKVQNLLSKIPVCVRKAVPSDLF